ncbi:hypothetical protein E2C01_060503 [Portunus trituberculatus]|uniref:Uncharacterized protein n=1 Tax=Portunus trituberculatus TaxID=210409 RepID=A0A5B7H8W4_PORTR|nr:hypothetical protein [Portunus trituberculatus]
MCSIVCGAGLGTLVRVGHHNLCPCYIRRVSQSVLQPCTTRWAPHLRLFSQRFKSSAALLRIVGPDGSTESQPDNRREKTQAVGDGVPRRKPVRVMVIRGASHLKTLRSREAPVLHHAKARAMVDMWEAPASLASAIPNKHTEQEIHFTVDQLLRDSRKSLHIASHSQVQDEEDVEYSSERRTRKPEEPELVGALPPGALDWRPQLLDVWNLGNYYADLAKSRLTAPVGTLEEYVGSTVQLPPISGAGHHWPAPSKLGPG